VDGNDSLFQKSVFDLYTATNEDFLISNMMNENHRLNLLREVAMKLFYKKKIWKHVRKI
jgi:hypothetical protein